MALPQTNYLEYLSHDPKLKKLLTGAESRVLQRRTDLTFFLYSTIVQQQLSTRVGEVFLERFLNIYHGHKPTSREVIETPMGNFTVDRLIAFQSIIHKKCGAV
jgi:DNA-3-methyladenine glycosylase II